MIHFELVFVEGVRFCLDWLFFLHASIHLIRLSWWLSSKESACRARVAGDVGLTPGSGRPPGGGHGNPLQYSCLENPVERGAWQVVVHRVEKSRTWLKQLAGTHPLDQAPFVEKTVCAIVLPLLPCQRSVGCIYVGTLLDSLLFRWSICLFFCQCHTALITVAV